MRSPSSCIKYGNLTNNTSRTKNEGGCIMNKNELQECITECESALTHLNNAMRMAHAQSKPKMEHAARDLEECISECRSLL